MMNIKCPISYSGQRILLYMHVGTICSCDYTVCFQNRPLYIPLLSFFLFFFMKMAHMWHASVLVKLVYGTRNIYSQR